MFRTASRVAALAAVALLCCESAVSATTPQLTPMPLQEALTTKRLALYTSIATSPDGRYIAYTVEDNARADRVPRPWNRSQSASNPQPRLTQRSPSRCSTRT